MELRVNKSGLPILDQFSEDGFIDCVFRITHFDDSGDYYRFHLAASYEEVDLEFGVEVLREIKSGFDAEMSLIPDRVYQKGVRFFRTGSASDQFISVLAALYGISECSCEMVAEETFTAIALHQEERDMAVEPVKIKIFGKDREGDVAEDYYESFFNIDVKNGFVFWNEKDQAYRVPLVRGLSVRKS